MICIKNLLGKKFKRGIKIIMNQLNTWKSKIRRKIKLINQMIQT